MNRLASPAQLRASLIRWGAFLVPLVCLLGFLSGQVSGSAADNPWFEALAKPALYPPPIVFPVVWSVLYVLMGVAFAGICSAWGSRMRAMAIVAFLVQFSLNLAWSPVFFSNRLIDMAFYIIVALAVALAVTIALFWQVRRWAGVLLLPYLAWVLFASVLNWQFWQLNPDASRNVAGPPVQRIEL